MKLITKLKDLSKNLKNESSVYRAVLRDKRTPLFAKLLLGLALGYVFFPFDIIPDYIPVLGQIDDLIIVLVLFYFVRKLIPNEIFEEHRKLLCLDNSK